MRYASFWSLALALVPLCPAAAQKPAPASPQADSLRQRIEERFTARAKAELGLTDDQAAKLRVSSREFGTRRRELQMRERGLREALGNQLRPGVAANQDSVARLTDAMIELRMNEAQSSRDEMKDLSRYLNPVQRGRLFVMRERFRDRVREVHGHRGEWRGNMQGEGRQHRGRERTGENTGRI